MALWLILSEMTSCVRLCWVRFRVLFSAF